MKRWADCVVLALGLTTLHTTWLIGPLINPTHLAVYHWAGSTYSLFLPPTLDFLAVFLLLTAFLLSFQINELWNDLGWAFLLFLSPWFLFKNAVLLYPAFSLHKMGWFLLFPGAIGFLYSAARRNFRESKRYVIAVDFFSTLLRFVAIGGILALGQVAWFAWQARNLNRDLPTHFSASSSVPHAQKSRIFWIVLDELSYQQTYGRRFPGLQLPAFDRLAADSTIFTQVVAAGTDTQKVLPALLTGAAVDAVRSSPEGMLETHGPESGEWVEFQQKDTVFQDAIGYGYQTALAGWYNPYCRILPSVLHRCSWTIGAIDNAMEYRASVAHNMLGPLRYELLIGRSYHSLQKVLPLRNSGTLSAAAHIADYQDLARASSELAQAPENEFLLLHMPIPHPGGIYDRRKGELTEGTSSYLDNLALADNFLAHLETLLRETGQWDTSTLVIMGDHGWRTDTAWTSEPGWSAEDEQASQNEALNRRPAMIVKLPGQTSGARIDERFRALQTRKLMNAFFLHEIKTSEDLREWVKRNP